MKGGVKLTPSQKKLLSKSPVLLGLSSNTKKTPDRQTVLSNPGLYYGKRLIFKTSFSNKSRFLLFRLLDFFKVFLKGEMAYKETKTNLKILHGRRVFYRTNVYRCAQVLFQEDMNLLVTEYAYCVSLHARLNSHCEAEVIRATFFKFLTHCLLRKLFSFIYKYISTWGQQLFRSLRTHQCRSDEMKILKYQSA